MLCLTEERMLNLRRTHLFNFVSINIKIFIIALNQQYFLTLFDIYIVNEFCSNHYIDLMSVFTPILQRKGGKFLISLNFGNLN